jgi:hypothetical protein
VCGIAALGTDALPHWQVAPKSTALRDWSDERFVADSLGFSLFACKKDSPVAKRVAGTDVLPAARSRYHPDLRAQSLSSQFHEEIVLFRTIHHYSYFGMAVVVAV